MIKRDYASWATEDVAEQLEALQECRRVALRRTKIADSEAVKLHLEELELRRREIQRQYRSINVKIHPSTVVATLAALQGQEEEVRDQIRVWQTAKKKQKSIDAEIALCENILVERQKRKQ